jgi:cytochrome c peroxidase
MKVGRKDARRGALQLPLMVTLACTGVCVTLAAEVWRPARHAFAAGVGNPRAEPYAWRLPHGFPEPKVPAENPMSAAKVDLGRRLFYDTRLSGNQTFSCSNCHQQSRAFADPLPRGVGSTGAVHPRGSMALANVAYSPVLTWANPNVRTLEQQALLPMFGETPVELGLAGKEQELIARLGSDTLYQRLFPDAFSDSSAISVRNVTRAIAAFERTIVSGTSPYDRYLAGEKAAISPSAVRGAALFFSEKLECFHCHGGFNFTNTVDYKGKGFLEIEFHNTGLYNIGGKGNYPADNAGIREHTGKPDDMGKFKAPSLRNIALTAPYMHDGSIRTLGQVLSHYAAGGRAIAHGPNAGVGSRNPFKSSFVKGFTLASGERRDVLAFLHSLTDSAFIADPRYADPSAPPGPASSRCTMGRASAAPARQKQCSLNFPSPSGSP